MKTSGVATSTHKQNIKKPLHRDPKRIPIILDRIREIWEKQPQLRLGQLIIAGVTVAWSGKEYTPDPFYVEDDNLVLALERKFSMASRAKVPLWKEAIDK